MSSHSEDTYNGLGELLCDYSDEEVSKSSLEDGECTSPSSTTESIEKEQKLRQKLLESLSRRKRHSECPIDAMEKYRKIEYDESFSHVRSRFDSFNTESSDDDKNDINSKNEENQNNYNNLYEGEIKDLFSMNDIYNGNDAFNASEVQKEEEKESVEQDESNFPIFYPSRQGCRSVDNYEMLNRVEEGTYGEVFRGKDRNTGRIYALKKLKLDSRLGFPITSIREVNTLMQACNHENVVRIREVVTRPEPKFAVYLVMEFVEHDLKSFLKVIRRPLQISEVKCLMYQLLSAVAYLHENWIIHRDLKTSNLLLSHSGILKVADFGLAREFGSPLKSYTQLVVTLWYRAPELLLGVTSYSTQIDVWSVGCIFGELLLNRALFPGKTEDEQIQIIFRELGVPDEDSWPGFNCLPIVKRIKLGKLRRAQPKNEKKLRSRLSNSGFSLFSKFLTMCPEKRISAEEALKHNYFSETPYPLKPSEFPKYPAKSENVDNSKSKGKK